MAQDKHDIKAAGHRLAAHTVQARALVPPLSSGYARGFIDRNYVPASSSWFSVVCSPVLTRRHRTTRLGAFAVKASVFRCGKLSGREDDYEPLFVNLCPKDQRKARQRVRAKSPPEFRVPIGKVRMIFFEVRPGGFWSVAASHDHMQSA
jgi:hypothetical protein